MQEDVAPLSAEERAELEQLRAEKAAREERERNRAERAELERLRAQSRSAAVPARTSGADPGTSEREAQRIREARDRGRRLMEPTDDLAMPLGQKIVLGAVALIVLVIVVAIVFGGR